MGDAEDRIEGGYGKAWVKAPAKRMAEIISTLLAIGFVLNAYILHVHAERDSSKQVDVEALKDNQRAMQRNQELMIQSLKEMVNVQKESLEEQREQTCLQRLDKSITDRSEICRQAVRGARRDTGATH